MKNYDRQSQQDSFRKKFRPPISPRPSSPACCRAGLFTCRHKPLARIAYARSTSSDDMAQTGKSPAAKTNGVNGHTPSNKNCTDSTRSNGKKRSRGTAEDDVIMDDVSNTSQRKSRPSTPSSTPKTSRTVYMRDEDDLDANDDDDLARMSNGSQGKLKKRKSLGNLTEQERRLEGDKRKEKAKRLAAETATLPVNTGM